MERRRNAVYIIITLSLLAGLATGRSFFFNIAYAFGGLLIFSLLWAWSGVNWLRLSRQTRARRAQVGRYLEERFTVQNTGILPKLWLEFYDQSTLPGHHAGHVVSSLRPRGADWWLARTLCLQRGEYRLGPIQVVTGDPFGFFHIERTISATSRLIVYPPVIPITEFALPIGVLPGGDALRRRTHYITANASGVRDYAPGDSFNRIHWRSTARKNRLIVKEFELDPLADIWIMLDAERAAHGGSYRLSPIDEKEIQQQRLWIPPSTEEYAVAIAASLAVHFLRKERSVGFVAHGQRREMIQVDRGGRQLTKILETLAVVRAEGTVPLDHLLTLESDQLVRGATVIVITPSTREDWVAAAHRLVRRGVRVIAVLLDGRSFGGRPGIEQTAMQLAMIRVPSYIIHKDDDLSVSLSRPL